MRRLARFAEWLTSGWRIACLAVFGLVAAVALASIASPIIDSIEEERRIRATGAPVETSLPPIRRNGKWVIEEQTQMID